MKKNCGIHGRLCSHCEWVMDRGSFEIEMIEWVLVPTGTKVVLEAGLRALLPSRTLLTPERQLIITRRLVRIST